MNIELKWDGPLRLFDREQNISDVLQQNYENKKGVYLFGCKYKDSYIINYVGKADNILKRMREHIVCTLGGAYRLLDYSKIKNNGITESRYQLENDLSIKKYLENFKELSELAFQNVISATVFIACSQDNQIISLKLIESAFINFFQNNDNSKSHISNYGVSKYNDTGEVITIKSLFNSGVQILGNPIIIEY